MKFRREKELEKIHQMMAEQGFHPTTNNKPKPATQPTVGTPEDL